MILFQKSPLLMLLAGAALLSASSLRAAPFVVTKSSLQPPQVTFSEVPNNTALDGLSINGFTFVETGALNSASAAHTRTAAQGSGNTNNLSGDRAVGVNNPNYLITVIMGVPQAAFGFGFAINIGGFFANAVVVTLFNGAINLGSLGFSGNSDPSQSGGFVGIGNAIPFTSAQIRFNNVQAGEAVAFFAIDNVSASTTAVPAAIPETGTTLNILGIGILAIAANIFHHRRLALSRR